MQLCASVILKLLSGSSSLSCFAVYCDLCGHVLPDHLLQLQCLQGMAVLQLQVVPVYISEILKNRQIQVVGPVFDQHCRFVPCVLGL